MACGRLVNAILYIYFGMGVVLRCTGRRVYISVLGGTLCTCAQCITCDTP